jgi:hypothetical protein
MEEVSEASLLSGLPQAQDTQAHPHTQVLAHQVRAQESSGAFMTLLWRFVVAWPHLQVCVAKYFNIAGEVRSSGFCCSRLFHLGGGGGGDVCWVSRMFFNVEVMGWGALLVVLGQRRYWQSRAARAPQQQYQQAAAAASKQPAAATTAAASASSQSINQTAATALLDAGPITGWARGSLTAAWGMQSSTSSSCLAGPTIESAGLVRSAAASTCSCLCNWQSQ